LKTPEYSHSGIRHFPLSFSLEDLKDISEVMDDFTFCQGNPLADEDQLDSPKPMPRVSDLCIDEKSDSAEHGKPKASSDTSSKIFQVAPPNESDSAEHGKPKVSSDTSSKVFQVAPPKVKSAEVQETATPKGSAFKQPVAITKLVRRAKVPFEKGYSQMDWLKLTQTHPDLAGLKGSSNRRFISMDEVKQHKSEGDIWTVLKGRVYNISPYMKFHPGGEDMLMKASGKDCSALFNKYHAWVNAEFLLEKCLVGLDVPT